MFGINYEWMGTMGAYGALVLTAFSVRWLDDAVDESPRFVPDLGPYGLLALAVAGALDTHLTVTMFTACYALGMFGEPQRSLPSRLSPSYESAMVLSGAVLISGWQPVMTATLIVTVIQIVDDLHDVHRDAATGAANLAIRFGTPEVALFGLGILVAAAYVAPLVLVLALAAIPPAEMLYRFLSAAPLATRRGKESITPDG